MHLKTAFNEALGVRRVRDYREPLQWAVSLSQPIGEPGGDTLADVLPGPDTGLEDAEEEIWREQLCTALVDALEKLPTDWRRILKMRYWWGKRMKQIAAEEGISHQAIANKTASALKRLRKMDTAGRLREFICQ
ncbi:sigma-70 family RNA polymerase sigma factor [uncultured Dysosmobacter sp.]|uniref:sigma-70 family RNA polymerase sigma factor n=1 Tax=uncultured Dysosmobacter sp. TaxID=2591384 RepID=UPI0026056272|nr:sigma-70 family RNA polymerase sigma factor [uncultured Dysosmobacter sp.]